MDTIMYYICYSLGYIMKWCWELVGNYGVVIILFTLATKIVLLPVSVWVHKNSIRIVKIQPQINRLKAKLYGDREHIAEEQTKLYKEVHYSPFANSIPLLIQLILLAAVVYIIKQPLTHILRLDADTIRLLAEVIGVDAGEGQLAIVKAAADGGFASLVTADPSLASAVEAIRGLDMSFCGFDLGVEAWGVWGVYTHPVLGDNGLLAPISDRPAPLTERDQGGLRGRRGAVSAQLRLDRVGNGGGGHGHRVCHVLHDGAYALALVLGTAPLLHHLGGCAGRGAGSVLCYGL